MPRKIKSYQRGWRCPRSGEMNINVKIGSYGPSSTIMIRPKEPISNLIHTAIGYVNMGDSAGPHKVVYFRKKRLDLSSHLLVKDLFDGNETIYVKDGEPSSVEEKKDAPSSPSQEINKTISNTDESKKKSLSTSFSSKNNDENNDPSSSMNNEDSNTNDNTLLSNVFSQNKIKSMYLNDERIGKVSADAIDLIGK